MGALLDIARQTVAPDRQRTDESSNSLSDRAAEARRQRVLAKLAGNSALRIAIVCDGEGDPVPVTVGIRDKGTCEVYIPAARFDPFTLLELAARHGGIVH